MENDIKDLAKAEKLVFNRIILEDHITTIVKNINKLAVEIEQARGALIYLRSIESKFKFE